MGLQVAKVKFASPAYRAGLRKGDEIVAFDGHAYSDALDFAYYDGQSSFGVTYTRKGRQYTVRIDKPAYMPMGVEYVQEDMPIRHCTNRCIFCFVEQCPKGMRPSLYVKDDDYRMSFACGSYVTLSNLTDEDVARILRMGLSPLYISVHAYDPQVKTLLCANPKSTKVFDYMQTFAVHGIVMHTQIVMVEGINDGAVLQETLTHLYAMYPQVRSVAIVPVGLTGHREGLYPLHPVSAQCAAATVDMVAGWQQRSLADNGTRWVWCSDEMYLLAQRPMPDYDFYEDYVQIENGVGMVTTFVQEVQDAMAALSNADLAAAQGAFTLVTGVGFATILQPLAANIAQQCPHLTLDVVPIRNDWFGPTVTVSGLLTGRDIVAQLSAHGYHKDVVIPGNTLKEFETLFLDGMSVEQLQQALQCTIHISDNGKEFVDIVTGRKRKQDE